MFVSLFLSVAVEKGWEVDSTANIVRPKPLPGEADLHIFSISPPSLHYCFPFFPAFAFHNSMCMNMFVYPLQYQKVIVF